MTSRQRVAAAPVVAAALVILILLVSANDARAQSLKVMPVNIQMGPGEKAATLTVINDGSTVTAIQVRTYAWSQTDGKDQLTTSDAILASPPIVTIAPGDSQVVRLVLRRTPQGHEATYRILLDQIPPAAEVGIVHIVLRLSIPVFAQPMARAVPRVHFYIERNAGQVFLVGVNDGLRHEAIRNIVLSTSDGRQLTTASGASPYILAGVTRRWEIEAQNTLALENDTLRMTALTDGGTIEQQVRLVGIP